MLTREEALMLPAFCLVDDRISLYLERHINEIYDSFESQLSSNPLQHTNSKIIHKGQVFDDGRNGRVYFAGIDSCCGERSAILICSDGSKKYPLLVNMPEFTFIDN